MELVIVRHGESIGNAEKRMQGHGDYPLSDVGRGQAERLARWLESVRVTWDIAYASPLARAFETAEILARHSGSAPPLVEPMLKEVGAGRLEGLTREDMAARYPEFLKRPVTGLAEFSDYGGESYQDVQARVETLAKRFEADSADDRRLLLVGHGGINFQLLKRLICVPVPRVCIVRMGNCSATLVKMRERRGVHLGEITWHVPVELMGGTTGEGSRAIFR